MSGNKTYTTILNGAGEDIVLSGCPFVPKKVTVLVKGVDPDTGADIALRYEKLDSMPDAESLLTGTDGAQSFTDAITIGENLHAPATIGRAVAAANMTLYVCCEGY